MFGKKREQEEFQDYCEKLQKIYINRCNSCHSDFSTLELGYKLIGVYTDVLGLTIKYEKIDDSDYTEVGYEGIIPGSGYAFVMRRVALGKESFHGVVSTVGLTSNKNIDSPENVEIGAQTFEILQDRYNKAVLQSEEKEQSL